MSGERLLPENPLEFIRRCVRRRDLLWTYHVNMRLAKRHIPRGSILDAVETFELIESYPDDKYLPSYLVYAQVQGSVCHVLFAADVPGHNVRVVTATGQIHRSGRPI
ncbi:MAG TPA: DUF4258 domain-containing protein [Thermoanaerobaculia bacterium]|jgi:hypothetical protein|nr:DUF4258 domain-containing protein [Thermoanaerobaculia bacterium]